jgi:hypothetical protein
VFDCDIHKLSSALATGRNHVNGFVQQPRLMDALRYSA